MKKQNTIKAQFQHEARALRRRKVLTAWRILQQFKKIFLRLRLGVLFIGHHRRHIRFLAERVLVLEQGRLLGS